MNDRCGDGYFRCIFIRKAKNFVYLSGYTQVFLKVSEALRSNGLKLILKTENNLSDIICMIQITKLSTMVYLKDLF